MDNNSNSIELRVKSLEERIQKIEAREKRRQVFGIIKAVVIIVVFAIVVIYGIHLYQEFTKKIEPLMDITEKTQGFDWKSLLGN